MKAVSVIVIACFWASSAFGGPYDRNWPSEGLVSKWSGEGNAKDSTGEHHGRVVGAVKYAKGVSGRAFDLDGRAYIDMGNPAGLRVTGNQTVAMWLKPARLGVRQNPLSKAYGGEMTFTLEPTGVLNYYYGMGGGNSEPYTSFTSGKWFKVGKWTHVAVVRDFKARKIRFYVDGVLRNEGAPGFTKTKASGLPMYIGKGYVNNYKGLVDEVCIWNRALDAWEISAVVGAVPLTVSSISRDVKLDSVRTLDGSVLLGAIEKKDWSITTSYGKFKIPAARVVGFLSKPVAPAATSRPAAPHIRMVLTDGQVLAGRLSVPLVQLKLPGGQMLKIPIAQIRQCGYRIGPEKPAGAVEFRKVDERFPATSVLNSGDLLLWDSSGATIRFKSACGMLDLRPEIVSSIAAARNNTWRANLKDFSSITGFLASEELKLKLKLGKEISVPSRNVAFLSFSIAIAKPPDATTMLLRNGDRLSGKLVDKQLAVQTDYGSVKVATAGVWKILRQADGEAELTMQNLTVLRGKLTAGSLAMILGSGVKLGVPVDQIGSVTFPRKIPADLVAKIEALIKELGDESAAKRKAASQKLIAMGKDILVVLKRHSNSKNLAINKGVKAVIDTLEGKVKPKTTIQLYRNGIDIPIPVTSVGGNFSGSVRV
ncbi:MAG: LamG domain-containing protein [Phycisphaerae bacterium]|jgi:hypothetical protein|nr:LamG domain-containing protein [Phycisphaerae bacterium]